MDELYCACQYLMPQEYKVGKQQTNDPERLPHSKGSLDKHHSLDLEQMALLEESITPLCTLQRIKCLRFSKLFAKSHVFCSVFRKQLYFLYLAG